MSREAKEQRKMGIIMQALAWLVFMALLGFYFSELLEQQYNPNQNVQTQHFESGVREVVLKRSKNGHYLSKGSINGHEVVFMLDTGATGVAIPMAVAQELSLKRGQRISTQTANGIATAYATRLDRVSVGDIALDNVVASISPGLQTQEVLLGMSFLRHIEFSQRGDTLTLRQYP